MKHRTRKNCKRMARLFVLLFLLLCVYHTIFRCTDTPLPLELAKNQTWLPANPENSAFVFSAYLEEEKNKVVIIGAMRKTSVIYICQLWSLSADGYSMEMDRSYPTAFSTPESHDRRYVVTLFECPFRSAKHPQYVSLITNTCNTPMNLIRVQKTKRPDYYRRTFTVCLSPLNFLYSRGYELIEWIELNRILGAEKFIIYNHSSAGNIAQVLDYYSKRDFTEVIQWRLPMAVDTYPVKTEPEIHYFAQSASLNDCLYRSKVDSEFVVNIDLDEFIVPRTEGTRNWKEMLRKVDRNKAKAFVFKNTYFRKGWTLEYPEKSQFSNVNKAKQNKLTTLNTFYREKKVYIKGVKSKYMVRTDGIRYLLIHFVPDLLLKEDITVAEEVGLLHHYRHMGQDLHNPNDSVTDFTIDEKFGKLLIRNIGKVWSELSNVDMGI